MNFKKKVSGSWIDVPHYISGTDTETITTLPATIYPLAQSVTIGLKGNTVQNGTPTPDNPIMPQGCGERTGNLFSSVWEQGSIDATTGQNEVAGTLVRTKGYIPITPNIAYSFSRDIVNGYMNVRLYRADKSYIGPGSDSTIRLISGSSVANPMGTRVSFCCFEVIDSEAAYIRFNDSSNNTAIKWYMVEGEYTQQTMPTYEPYGYKIPISSASTTTPVYLGEVQSTRQIKKLVLTGEESSIVYSGSKGIYCIPITNGLDTEQGGVICTHYLCQQVVNNQMLDQRIKETKSSSWGDILVIKDTSFADVTALKTFLAAEYAAGHPVTAWYILATSATGTVNEPLMKIDSYADSISGISIPTTAGANTLDVQTTLKPSEVTVNYKGWHPVADVHIYPDSSWMPTSWEEFRKAVRSGKAQSLYPVGTKLYENWGDTTSDTWIVVDYPTGEDYRDSDLAQQGYTNRVMLMEEKLNYLRVFDTKEAWLYVETAIPAGTYRFTIPNYDASYGGNKTYIFTSTADVPVSGQLTLTWAYNANPTKVQGYSSSTSTTALFDVTIAEWDGTTACTDLGTIKLAQNDADSTYGKLNHIHRARYGSNNYYQSGYRQWLNADATANNWWMPTNIFDRPYDNRNTAGRLNVMNSNMKAVLATPTINCITNNLFEYPSLDGTTFSLQTAYTVKDKLFLVTHTETNLSSTPNVNSVLDYYVGAQNADRIKYRKDNGNAYYWWLRTPYPTHASSVRFVNTSGALDSRNAHNTLGSAAACIIQ